MTSADYMELVVNICGMEVPILAWIIFHTLYMGKRSKKGVT